MCWIVNGICNLGFKPKQWRQVGVTKKDFLKCLAESDPSIALEFKQDKFLHWIRILKLARHHVAHQGTAVLSPLYEKPKQEPTDEEIDREIKRWEDWQELAKTFTTEVLESFRSTFRMQWREKAYKKISDAGFVIPDEQDPAIIFPLENIEWEYETFTSFVLAVVQKCMKRLASMPATS